MEVEFLSKYKTYQNEGKRYLKIMHNSLCEIYMRDEK